MMGLVDHDQVVKLLFVRCSRNKTDAGKELWFDRPVQRRLNHAQLRLSPFLRFLKAFQVLCREAKLLHRCIASIETLRLHSFSDLDL